MSSLIQYSLNFNVIIFKICYYKNRNNIDRLVKDMRDKKLLLILFYFSSLILSPIRVNARECSIQEITRLKKWANNIDIRYSYIEEGIEFYNESDEIEIAGNMFNVTISNLIPDLIVMDETFINKFFYNDEVSDSSTMTHTGYPGGERYTFSFYGNMLGPCNHKLITKKVITIPKYNFYSESDLCVGIEEFELCNKWYQGKIANMDYFVKAVNDYKKSILDNNGIDKNGNRFSTQFIKVLVDYYNIILIAIIILALSGIFIIKIREKKRGIL